ncbi:MAG TPA: beta-N-acetylhexosaminidase [Bacteroidales bacterium]|jgi:hexosaminidase|nr:MAG: Beta-hexosaminidase [Bacteroidetes bacterium ADurb.Bin145]HOU01469.1 beta-N-acetylhexosaminidase [Bacteroidales bacterium]HQK68932.1 beta-N-acetylhexosaminidase [Bacteroidales bacterium]
MKTNLLITAIIMIFISSCNVTNVTIPENAMAIIPAPLSMTIQKGNFLFSEKCRIVVSALDDDTKVAAETLALLIKNPTGMEIPVIEGTKAGRGSVFMTLDTAVKNNEGYTLRITPKKIIVRARTAAGLFYAVQTIRQLLPPDVEKESVIEGIQLSLPACDIVDEPAFTYRGMHLDVCRHMFPVEEIKKYIDMLAMHKMNTFHWHLTDDQGWRIEIKKLPELTKTGAYRKETVVGHARNKPNIFDGEAYGGFYTQEQIREIIDYAGSKFITVIPEIEMPGHSLAALASYPDIACTKGPFEVGTTWGVFSDVLCAGKEETFTFIQDVLTEVIDLFPGKYIHIGGDECPKIRWEKCPLCQKRIKDEGLADENELQSYFIRRIESFVTSKGKKIIGWDEILEGGLAPEATVMSWRGTEGGIAAARQKHDVIMTPTSFAYLDYYQTEPAGQPLAIGGYVPLEKVYSFNPLPEELTAEERKYILGVQGNVWTEYISTPEYLEYMAFPRAFAIAETGWTPDRLKDFDDFLARLEVLKTRYEALNLNYFKGEYRDTRKTANP